MISETVSHGGEEPALRDEKGEHLRRLARFALVDDVPDPWGVGGREHGTGNADPTEPQDD